MREQIRRNRMKCNGNHFDEAKVEIPCSYCGILIGLSYLEDKVS